MIMSFLRGTVQLCMPFLNTAGVCTYSSLDAFTECLDDMHAPFHGGVVQQLVCQLAARIQGRGLPYRNSTLGLPGWTKDGQVLPVEQFTCSCCQPQLGGSAAATPSACGANPVAWAVGWEP
jgi:hypothetical protein